jgi:hypothetical protein
MLRSLVGSDLCIRDSLSAARHVGARSGKTGQRSDYRL